MTGCVIQKQNIKEGELASCTAQNSAKKQGVSVRSVAKKDGVPPSTLHRHVQAESNIGAGRPTVLLPAEEKEIVYSCQVLQEMALG